MLLVGVHLHANAAATAVLVDQDFSHLKKYYRLLSTRRYSPLPPPESIKEALGRIYSDRRYGSRKRLFSQDGRPSKTTRSRPKLIVCSPAGCTATVDALRRRKIPVEGIFIDEDRGWRQEEIGKGLGHNYHLSADTLEAALLGVISEQRLACSEKVRPVTGAGTSPETGVNGPGRGEGTFTAALAAAVWFRETIRYTRPYRV